MSDHAKFKREIEDGQRFRFGRNWRRFLDGVTNEKIVQAQLHLRMMLGSESLAGRSFLDIGCGSGLSSLAARRLGAKVTAFDYDPESVAASMELRSRESSGDSDWTISVASILDDKAMSGVTKHDIVYSWGVLHHTGDMWRAIDAAAAKVAPSGSFYIAIYNDQGWISRYWKTVKRAYNANSFFRTAIILFHAPYLFGARFLYRLATGRLHLERGMSMWHDMLDWLGGYPFEVSPPEAIVAFCGQRGFEAQKTVTCGNRHGCNEFVFRRSKGT